MSNKPTVVVKNNPHMEIWRPYTDSNGCVYFKRKERWSARTKYYRYSFALDELTRVYSKNRDMKIPRTYVWGKPQDYVRYDRLEPIIPKHLVVDVGL